MNAEWLTNVVIIFVLTICLTVESSSTIHLKGRGKHNSNLHANQHGPRRSGILETVQAIPTSATPTTRVPTRVNTPANSTKGVVKNLDSAVNNTLDLKTNFSPLVHDNAAPGNVTVVQNSTNKLQNLVSYSLDQPNSFPRPTSIPEIDTISAAWPTPMGSIDNEMDDVSNPPSMQPIANEMSSEEKIPGIQGIPNMARIPLDFQEEPGWERSDTTTANITAGHAIHGHVRFSLGHAASRHFVPSPSRSLKRLLSTKGRETTSAFARRRSNVVVNTKGLSRIRKKNVKLSKFRRREKFKSKTHSIVKHKGIKRSAKRSSKGNRKTWKKRVAIPPPKPIDPIQPLLEKFQKEKEVGDIKEHTVDIEKVTPNEQIDKHLISWKTQPEIKPIAEHLSKEKPDAIEPIKNHQLVENAK